MMNVIEMTEICDATLVAKSLAGNREAFGSIVARYQTLICSLAYSRTGSLTQSEDLAQEIFITAWKQLSHLREPHKLRSWLCGIAHNLIQAAQRKAGREPSHAAETLDAAHDVPALGAPTPDLAIDNEEAAILWRSLARLPEPYRDPLVLFYREHQSIQAVAEQLELSEANVKQRLSRGRKMLHQEVLAFVEGALERSNPGQTFTMAVLAALPITLTTSAKAASAATAAVKGGSMATGATVGSVLGVLAGPAFGLVCGYLGWRAGMKNLRTPREHAMGKRYAAAVVISVVVFVMVLLGFTFLAEPFWHEHLAMVVVLGVGLAFAFGIAIFISSWHYSRKFNQVREEERQLHPELFRVEPLPTVWEYRSRATFLGLPLVHCRSGRLPGKKMRPAVGWFAFGEVAFGVLYASGAIAVGGIAMGGVGIGLIGFGGFALGAVAFGGVAVGGVALGGVVVGVVASGGFALGWHAALGGAAIAHELALGGSAQALHANDDVAREFFIRYRWLDTTQPGPCALFWSLCFGPMFVQVMLWNWWQRKMRNRANQK